MSDGFWCEYCGKKKSWDDRDYDFGLYLAEAASFEALGHTEYADPYLICKQCADVWEEFKNDNTKQNHDRDA